MRRKSGGYELRESIATPAGPRSRTLASFRELTDDVIEHGQTRASTPLDADQIQEAALRAGAPISTGVGAAAARLLDALSADRPPTPGLRRVLLDALGASPRDPLSAEERTAAEWVGSSLRDRGETLRDLLGLADRLPTRRSGKTPGFPRIDSGPA